MNVLRIAQHWLGQSFGHLSRRAGRDADGLQVFISSRQTPELLDLRRDVARALRRVAFVPWVFEETPAAPYPPELVYVPAVRASHVVVWLAGTDTSSAMEREVLTAIEAKKPIFAFRVGKPRRSADLEALLERAREHATTLDAPDVSAVPEQVVAAVGRDLVQRYAGAPVSSRTSTLRLRALQSRAQSIVRWETAGIEAGLAAALADDPEIGPDLAGRMVAGCAHVLLGGLGAGKSLVVERTFRTTVRNALASPLRPIPVFLHAAQLPEGLEAAVRRSAQGLGDPAVTGARVVIDAANEPGAMAPRQLLLEARTLARAWPDTSVLITSQPIEPFLDYPERIELELLSDATAEALIARVSGTSIDLAELDLRLRETIRYPLFALLYAQALSPPDGRRRYASRTELVRWLVGRALGDQTVLGAALERLAALVLEQSGDVRAEDAGTYDERRALLRTGLVRTTLAGRLNFGLPVLIEWFAAQHLLRDAGNRVALVSPDDFSRRDLWSESVALALAMADTRSFGEVAAALVRVDPAYAARAIGAALDRWGDGNQTVGDARTYGEDLQSARSAWLAGLGGLGSAVIETDRGAPVAVATRMDGELLTILEARPGVASPGEVRDAPDERVLWEWPRRVQTAPRGRFWAWKYQLSEIERGIAAVLEQRALYVASCLPQRRETAWAAARTLTGGNLMTTRVPITAFEEALRNAGDAVLLTSGPDIVAPTSLLRDEIAVVRAAGREEITEPWPGRDGPVGSWIWSGYGGGRLLQRAREVYDAAATIYTSLVESYFSTFAPRLRHYVTFPARLVGIITPADETKGLYGEPGISLVMVPMPAGSANSVQFVLKSSPIGAARLEDLLDPPHQVDLFDYLSAAVERNRRGRSLRLAYTSSAVLEVYGSMPANELAWSWLASDLRDIGFVNSGIFPRPV